MDEQTVGAIAKVISTIINQNAAIETANKAFYASIITSAASILVCIITVFFNHFQTIRVKQKEYIDDYYKYIVKKRIAAYERLESLISSIKSAAVDDDRKAYHLIFSNEDSYHMEYNMLLTTTAEALWLSEEAFEVTRRLNYVLLEVDPAESDIIQFGKENYERIANLREELEKILAMDMLELHNVEKFLKKKNKRNSEFIPVKIA